MKKFIKNNLKTILIAGVTAIICISGTVFATGYLAKDISYTREGTNIKNVQEALNDLYKKQIRFDTNDNMILRGTSAVVSSLGGFEIGKYYIIYIRHSSDNLPTLTDVEFVMPMKKMEQISTDKISHIYTYIGIIKAQSTTITLSEGTVISAKQLYN